MAQLSLLAESLVGSEIVKLGNEISQRIRNGEEIYNYTIGDFDSRYFPIPDRLLHGVMEAYQQGYTNYPPGEGLAELREAVCTYFERHFQITYALNEVQISSGGRPLIYSLFRTLIDEHDKVIYAVPSWNNNHYVHMNWGSHCVIQTDAASHFMPRALDIAPHMADAVLICLCSPQNPTGTVMDPGELEQICDMVLETNASRGPDERKVFLMYDQMYSLLTHENTKHVHPVGIRPAMKEYTVYVDGISKSMAATGVRVGWSTGPAPVIAKMKAFLSHIGAWAPMAEQKATAAFLKDDVALEDWLVGFKSAIWQRLSKLSTAFRELKSQGFPVDLIEPRGGIYLTVKIDIIGKVWKEKLLETPADVNAFLLSEARLAIVPFSCFGANLDSPWFRISVGTASLVDLDTVIKNLTWALKTLTSGI
jgi:aspartate aminotransferase